MCFMAETCPLKFLLVVLKQPFKFLFVCLDPLSSYLNGGSAEGVAYSAGPQGGNHFLVLFPTGWNCKET